MAISLHGSGDHAVRGVVVGQPRSVDESRELSPQKDGDQAFFVHLITVTIPALARLDECGVDDVFRQAEGVESGHEPREFPIGPFVVSSEEPADELGNRVVGRRAR